MIILVLKCLFLFLAILYGFSNIGKVFLKNNIGSGQLLLMTIGIVGFILIQFWI